MIKLLAFAALTIALHAEDANKSKDIATILTDSNKQVEQLQQQLAAKDQEIGRLQAQLQQAADAYQGCVVSRAQMSQRPTLNPQQQQMMQRGPKPTPDKP